jgi:uncharacterized Zn finger protein (UPF0148 family)
MSKLIEKKDRLFEIQDVKEFQNKKNFPCDECDSSVTEDNGEMVCPSCGLVSDVIYETQGKVETEIPIREANLERWMQKALDRQVIDPRTKLGSFF